MTEDTRAEANKRLVRDFYRCVFDAQNPDAVSDFVAEDYQQHAMHVPSGRAGLEEFVRSIFPDGPRPVRPEMERPPAIIVAEGDLVVLATSLPQPEPDDPGNCYPSFVYDAFRIRDGKLAEHWSGVNKVAPPKH